MEIQKALIRFDRFCEVVPFASTVLSLINLFQKCVLSCLGSSAPKNRYWTHISDKSIFRCLILLIPMIGNIYAYLHPSPEPKQPIPPAQNIEIPIQTITNKDLLFRSDDLNYEGFSQKDIADLQFAENCTSYPKLALHLSKGSLGFNCHSACQRINQYINANQIGNSSISLNAFINWHKVAHAP